MDQSRDRFAYRCLPLVIANQGGWIIRCPISFSVRWNGGPELADLKVRKLRNSQGQSDYIVSHFGGGVLTILLPYLFRTPRGINLWVKGPSNWIKDGIQPLEGVVETDWNESTFTMNWKLTRRNHTVHFEQVEPICVIVPIPRGLAESFDPVCQPLSTNPTLEKSLENGELSEPHKLSGSLAISNPRANLAGSEITCSVEKPAERLSWNIKPSCNCVRSGATTTCQVMFAIR